KRSMVQATRNYLTLEQEGKNLPVSNGSSIVVTLNELMSSNHIKPVLDPKTKELVDIIRSKVTVTKTESGFTYDAVIVSPTCGDGDSTDIVVEDNEELLIWNG